MRWDDKHSDGRGFSIDYPIPNPEKAYAGKRDLLNPDHESIYGHEPLLIPLAVFHSKLSTMQLVVKYLHDYRGLDFKEISRLTGRAYKTVWTTYSQVKGRELVVVSSSINVPVSIFSTTSLSPLEALVSYLKSLDLRNSEIAVLLMKDQRTVWTVFHRASEKEVANG